MKKWIKALCFLLILVCFFAFNRLVITPRYTANMIYTTYLDKAARAESISGPRMIFLGGSGANLSLSAREFTRLSGTESVNMAVVAEVPVEISLRMAQLHARPGDTVILVLESFAFVAAPTDYSEGYLDMVAVDENLSTVETPAQWVKYQGKQFLRGFSRLNDLISYYVYQKADPDSMGSIYTSGTADEYGDFFAHQGLKPTYQPVSTVGTTDVSLHPEMVALVRKACRELEERGVTVYITYAPTDGFRYENREAFYGKLQEMAEEAYGEWILGTPFDFHYPADMFFDSDHHMRYECRDVYTADLYRIWQEAQNPDLQEVD